MPGGPRITPRSIGDSGAALLAPSLGGTVMFAGRRHSHGRQKVRYCTEVMSSSQTAQELAKITDEGRFEQLATAVLRRADPLYRNLCHVGVNAAGQTRKSPLDGICFAPGADPPRIIAAHHTITEGDDLRKKWLHDPSTVRRRKGSRSAALPGDLIKTSQIVEKERKRSPNLRATLTLTCKGEPLEDLVRDVTAAGNARSIDVDIWSRSRLCDFLDHDPRGQWLRHEFLGIEQEQLSEELLRELSNRSLDVFAQGLHDAPAIWVDRGLDGLLEARSLCKLTFLVGGSGSGKSVACYRRLRAHVDAGGVGLVVRHEDVASEMSLEAAVSANLRQLHPALAQFDPAPFSLCSSERPLFVVVEDINHATQPHALVEKLAAWTQSKDVSGGSALPPWRILCPAWPEAFPGIHEQVRRELEGTLLLTTVFAPSEGRDAVLRRERAAGYAVSPLKASEISEALGHDPLLIALHNPGELQDAHQIIGEFVNGALSRAATLDSAVMAGDGREALRIFAGEMLQRRQLDLDWREIRTWDSLQGEPLRTIATLAKLGELLRLTGPSSDQRLSFRHDRVRDWLLSDAAADMEHRGLLPNELLQEPYFAEIIGAVLAFGQPMPAFVDRVAAANPLALFCALRLLGSSRSPAYSPIRAAALAWLDSAAAQDLLSNAHLRVEVLKVLCETDSSDVLELVRKLGAHGTYADLALLRNGDLAGGISLCVHAEPGIGFPLRDLWIEHARLRYGDMLINRLGTILGDQSIDGQARSGALRLAGHVADPRLASAVETCWNGDVDRSSLLSDYLWAFAKCCGSDAARYLAPVCDAWGALSDKEDSPGMGSPRSRLGANGIDWAFRREPPSSATEYLILHGRANEGLRWPIMCMLHGVDVPCAVEFVVNELASIQRRLVGTDKFSPFVVSAPDEWRRAQEQGRPMSEASRAMLCRLWQDRSNDEHLRGQAFALWAATTSSDDIAILSAAEGPDDLADQFLWERLNRGDEAAIPALREKLRSDENWTWWHAGSHVWSEDLTRALDESFVSRAAKGPTVWGSAMRPDYITSELVMRLPDAEAEQLLHKHWAHLRFSGLFLQAALYVGTPPLVVAVQTTVSECPTPAVLFTHIAQHYGLRVFGHPGLTREAQVLALAPYLDFLGQMDIGDFWDACNKHRWFATRRRLLDHRLDPPFLPPGREQEQLAEKLDELIAKEHSFLLRHWLDHFLDGGVAWTDLLGWMAAWLNERRSLKALSIVAQAIMLSGKRSDLEILDVCNSMPEEAAPKLGVDTRFAVRRSQPH